MEYKIMTAALGVLEGPKDIPTSALKRKNITKIVSGLKGRAFGALITEFIKTMEGLQATGLNQNEIAQGKLYLSEKLAHLNDDQKEQALKAIARLQDCIDDYSVYFLIMMPAFRDLAATDPRITTLYAHLKTIAEEIKEHKNREREMDQKEYNTKLRQLNNQRCMKVAKIWIEQTLSGK